MYDFSLYKMSKNDFKYEFCIQNVSNNIQT